MYGGGGSTEYVLIYLICLFVQPPYRPKRLWFARYGRPAAAVPNSQCKQIRKSAGCPAQTRDERGIALPMDLACHGIFLRVAKWDGCSRTSSVARKHLASKHGSGGGQEQQGSSANVCGPRDPDGRSPWQCADRLEGVEGVEGAKGVGIRGGCKASTR